MKSERRKLIEVALPLEAINRASAREKSIRHGHPSTLHHWWARRPLAAARAVLFAQLVDDPSSTPEDFPTEESQRLERARLHGLIERLVVWENSQDRDLFDEAYAEIARCADGAPPPVVDPFAGGGSIPLEAQRLGLDAHASDLNPVAVLINKALIELPSKFKNRNPVFPGEAQTQVSWEGTAGLAADVRAYGTWLRDQAEERLGGFYPAADGPEGTEATVIAWLWTRTVECPNPACRLMVPLVKSFAVCTRKGKEAIVIPEIRPGGVYYTVAPSGPLTEPTIGRSGGRCIACDAGIPLNYIREQGRKGRMGHDLLCTVAEGHRRRLYLTPDETELRAADVPAGEFPDVSLPDRALGFRVQAYGITSHRDLYTSRQQTLLTTLCELASEARQNVAELAGTEYADAILSYLALFIGRVANRSSSQCFWHAGRETVEQVFARNALPMVWNYAEGNPFSSSSGNMLIQLDYLVKALGALPAGAAGRAEQADAAELPPRSWVVSTDPPYYDNIPYADLSDFFYVWQRKVLRDTYPDLFGTVVTPKKTELISEPARHSTPADAARFFEAGLQAVFERMLAQHPDTSPMAVYYAFKQSEAGEDGVASTGWEKMLQGLVDAGGQITATWPLRTELAGGLRQLGRNALASSVVLAVRRRMPDAPSTDRRGFIRALHEELPDALRRLQQSAIAPVDLPQSAIGPGMAVFSSFSRVVENDGSTMTVRAALARVNEILDQVLNEQEGDFDAATRFAIAWYRQHGYATGKFGVADDLARARNTAVETLVRDGILTSTAGKVTLLSPSNLPEGYDVLTDDRVGTWEVLHHLIAILGRDGLPVAGAFLASAQDRPDGAIDTELVKELAFLLFAIAEKNGWTQDALAFNTVATAWPDIVLAARSAQASSGEQGAFDLTKED